MKEGMFYKPLNGKVRCSLCHQWCIIDVGQRGLCGVRENRQGKLYSLVYGKAVAVSVDPIEKKPFFHFYPGTSAYSIATVGCNFRCLHCQNADISQIETNTTEDIPGYELLPSQVVRNAKNSGCKSIAYTYTEPTIFFEYAFDIAQRAHEEGIKNVFVTNGFTGSEAIETIAPFLDAANIDLKGFSEDLYKEVCGAKLKPVLENIRLYKKLGIWIEITTLVIPGYNDDADQLEKIAAFIKSVGEEIPWHITAFSPAYKLPDVPRTKEESLSKAREIGIRTGLRYVYEGNIPGKGKEDTSCYWCGDLLVKRYGYRILDNKILHGKCPVCNMMIDGVGL